eukprot:6213919-Pleurochrysis_carterae.AAC.1
MVSSNAPEQGVPTLEKAQTMPALIFLFTPTPKTAYHSVNMHLLFLKWLFSVAFPPTAKRNTSIAAHSGQIPWRAVTAATLSTEAA